MPGIIICHPGIFTVNQRLFTDYHTVILDLLNSVSNGSPTQTLYGCFLVYGCNHFEHCMKPPMLVDFLLLGCHPKIDTKATTYRTTIWAGF